MGRAKTNNLTAQEEVFAMAYTTLGGDEFGNATAAYRKAYNVENMKTATVHRMAYKTLTKFQVAARIEEIRQEVAKKNMMEINDVFRNWVEIAKADPNEIMQHQRICCRHCWGVGHGYQYTQFEYAQEIARVISKVNKKKAEEIPELGGVGFDENKEPNPSCPVCFGNGFSRVFIADTRKLKGTARRLYGGVREKRGRIEIMLRDQDKALENIAKFLGMFKLNDGDKLNASGILPAKPSETTNDPVEASRIYSQLMTET